MKIETDVKLVYVVPFIVVLLAVLIKLEPFKLTDICSISMMEYSLLLSFNWYYLTLLLCFYLFHLAAFIYCEVTF